MPHGLDLLLDVSETFYGIMMDAVEDGDVKEARTFRLAYRHHARRAATLILKGNVTFQS